jgi:hypothetical protein
MHHSITPPLQYSNLYNMPRRLSRTEDYELFDRCKEDSMADDMQIKREIVLEADAETLQKMRKEGHARGFTVYCDEAERTGGENTAPPPLAYFGLSLAF